MKLCIITSPRQLRRFFRRVARRKAIDGPRRTTIIKGSTRYVVGEVPQTLSRAGPEPCAHLNSTKQEQIG